MSNPTPNQLERNTADDKIIKEIRNLFKKKVKVNDIKDKNSKRHKNLI